MSSFISKKENVSTGSFFSIWVFFHNHYESQDCRGYMIYIMRYPDCICYDHDHQSKHWKPKEN